jgi:hypothetical protein
MATNPTINSSVKEPPKATVNREPNELPFINWRSSNAKKILVADLHEGRLGIDDEPSSQEAWEIYRKRTDFRLVLLLPNVISTRASPSSKLLL